MPVAVAVLVVVLVGWLVHRFRLWLEQQTFLIAIFQWLTGLTLGERRQRAAWRAGQLPPGSRLARLPGRRERAVKRIAAVVLSVALLTGFMVLPQVTAWILAVLAICGLVLSAVVSLRWARQYRHRRVWLRPLHLAAADIAQIDPRQTPASWLQVEPDRSKAVLQLPAGWPGEPRDKQRLIEVAAAKLGMEQPEASWRLAGPEPQLTLLMSAPPPVLVRYDDLAAEVEKAREGEFICGTGRRGSVVKVHLSDSPHFAINSGTGGGKSALASFWVMQALRRGAIAMVLDNKWQSLPWTFKDEAGEYDYLPNIAYLSSPAQIHAGLVWLGHELDRRNQVARRAVTASGSLRGDVGPPIFVVAEELNLAMPLVRQHWADVREPDDVKRSPALSALGAVAFAGRAVKMHLILIGQMITAEATGSQNSSVKENVGVAAMARYGAAGWNTMVGRDVPMPPAPRVLGRFQVVSAAGVRETQVPAPDGVLYRELVLAGDVVPCPAGMPGARVPDLARLPAGGSEQGFVSETPPPVGQPGARLVLSEAVGQGIVPLTLTALRKASQRPGFPPRVGVRGLAAEYDAVALAEWAARR
jgi:hypothetical protein